MKNENPKYPKGYFEKLKSALPSIFFQSLYFQQPIPQDVKDKEDFDIKIQEIGFCPLDEKEIKHFIDAWRKIYEEFPVQWRTDKPVYDTITKGLLSMKSKEEILINLDILISQKIANIQYMIATTHHSRY